MGDSGDGKEETKRTGLLLQGGSHGNLRSAGNDQQLKQMLHSLKSSKFPVVISYGASCKFSNEFKNLTFIYADTDECPETTQSISYTPTFHFYWDGEKVDEMLGTGEQRVRDCMIASGCIPDGYLTDSEWLFGHGFLGPFILMSFIANLYPRVHFLISSISATFRRVLLSSFIWRGRSVKLSVNVARVTCWIQFPFLNLATTTQLVYAHKVKQSSN